MKQNGWKMVLVLGSLFLLAWLALPQGAQAQPIPKVSLSIGNGKNPGDLAVTIEILLLLTILSLAPAILILTTSFTRIIVVLHFLRQALGLQQMPPNQLLIGLALFLTYFIMHPVFSQINDQALQPYLKKKISYEEALKKGQEPLRKFMLNQTREKDLALFVSLDHSPKPKNEWDVPVYKIVPAFVISELRLAFQIGFLLYIPFLVIDLVVASVLMSMGMLMLPPVMISLPFKILLFVMVDGWYLIIGSMVHSFG